MLEHGDPLWLCSHAGMYSIIDSLCAEPYWTHTLQFESESTRESVVISLFASRFGSSFGSSRYPHKSSREFSYIGRRPTSSYFPLPLAVREVGSDIGAVTSAPLVCVAPCLVGDRSLAIQLSQRSREERRNQNTTSLQSCYHWWVQQM